MGPFRLAEIPPATRYLSPTGELVGAETPMSDELAIRGLRCMLLGRRFDERSISLQRQGRMVTLAPGIGQEAASVGAAMALNQRIDWIVPQYREIAGQLWHGLPLRVAFLWHMGHPLGFDVPQGVNMLPFQASVAGQIPHAVGLAWGLKLLRTGGSVVTFFGDGATSEGDFHEAANLAGVMKAPVVMVCQNNRWAISTPVEQQTASPTLAQKAVAYGIHGAQCDGNDLFAVYATVQAAVARARAGEGASLIEALTYRLGLHTTADDPTRYVPAGEPAEWQLKDPIVRLQRYLMAKGAITESDLEEIEATVKEELAEAWKEAQHEPSPDPQHFFARGFAEPARRLLRQLDDLGPRADA